MLKILSVKPFTKRIRKRSYNETFDKEFEKYITENKLNPLMLDDMFSVSVGNKLNEITFYAKNKNKLSKYKNFYLIYFDHFMMMLNKNGQKEN